MSKAAASSVSADWELDYFSRPVLEADGKKRWELLICSTPAFDATEAGFRWVSVCPATSVNSIWLQGALTEALAAAERDGYRPPRRLRCWRASMRTMVQRAAEAIGLEVVPSRRCYALLDWLAERERRVYPEEAGYLAGPLAPPPIPVAAPAVILPEAVRGDRWSWATLTVAALQEASAWEIGFSGLGALPAGLAGQLVVPGIRLFSANRSLAIAGWMAGLEPVRLEINDDSLLLEAALENRWLLGKVEEAEAEAARAVFALARQEVAGLQFIAVQSTPQSERFDGFWLLRDLPDP
ncbi:MULTISPECIES: Tab2/Atab2 family RNA-binding protein [unclassified Synechococcus]|uniref:Tab2/Atab2 family RNA-binding protein n=1 Tax=unclassified Synechococcus TaxID=2626047 RepID=UPI0021A7DCDD|nr:MULTISPECIES: Tab2/Atab2 family RNA-binding protein [unclassified Synechococcus]MCT0213037.1 Tab2/Atab2 family RNA-binding protein [Synechococcus sp. CS-1326]MCT0232282.1 Tab2/Atab2 family RNA-binding protein [Synechococcus sp. CS-1327]